MAKISTYRDLVAWQLGKRVAMETYLTTRSMPREEMFGMTSQVRRAAISIPSNIAEGYARQSLPDYPKYLRIARGSLAELSTQLEIASDLQLIPPTPHLTSLLRDQERVLQALIKSLEQKLPHPPRPPSP